MDWKPIESAPRDWSDILVYDPELESDWRNVCEAYYDVEVKRWKSPAFGLVYPTHWMDLPEPPTSANGIGS